MMSYSSNWFTLLLLCTSALLVLCCHPFGPGSRQVKCKLVDLVTEDYDVSLCQQINKCYKEFFTVKLLTYVYCIISFHISLLNF